MNIDRLADSVYKRMLFDILDSFDLRCVLPFEPTRCFNDTLFAGDYVVSNVPRVVGSNLDLNISDHKVGTTLYDVYTRNSSKGNI